MIGSKHALEAVDQIDRIEERYRLLHESSTSSSDRGLVAQAANGVVVAMAAVANRTSRGSGAGVVGRGQVPADPALQRVRGVDLLPVAGGVAWPTGSRN